MQVTLAAAGLLTYSLRKAFQDPSLEGKYFPEFLAKGCSEALHYLGSQPSKETAAMIRGSAVLPTLTSLVSSSTFHKFPAASPMLLRKSLSLHFQNQRVASPHGCRERQEARVPYRLKSHKANENERTFIYLKPHVVSQLS